MIWRLTYCNKKGVEGRIDIIKGNRTPVEVVQGSANPFIISYRLDKNDKSGHIMTSSADIEIFETETFNIDDLKTSNETELKVEYFEGNVLTWSGFILPDFFSREIGSPNIVRMTASDRLTALKGVTLSDLPIRVSLRDLIELSLEQTGLDLALVAQIQINQGSTNILDSEILSQRLTDTRGRSISCYDILMSIMVATNSTIRQREGQWVVYNKLEHELRTPTIFFDKVERGAIRTIQPVASSVGVYQEFGGNRLHPNNYDFSNGLTNWTSRNGFEADIDNRVVSYFLGGTPIYQPDVTTKDYLVNVNDWITDETNLDTAPFLESNNIPIASTQNNTVEIEVDISAVMAEKLSSTTAISFLRYAVIATNGIDTYALTPNGLFEAYDPEKINEHSIILAGGQQSPLLLASPAYTNSSKRKGVLEVDNVNDFHINIRIYGSGLFQCVNVNFASVRFGNKTETPKGDLYKTTQGSNFTKQHDVETTIFGDYITTGLNGYFYKYPIDDTSNLYLPNGELSSPTWTTIFDTTERPLLHHISRQKSRLFSVAHDILKANINVESFDPLAIFQDCKGGKYVVVSASFDFLRSEVDVELEQIAYDNTILKRDFIYSYFGEGESNIKSIGGIAGGGGGTGGGGGMTSEQLEMLTNLASWWKLDEENDAIYSEKSVYSLKGVSALGLGSGGSGGGGDIDMLDSWANYAPAKADYYVPASLLVPFRSETLNRLTSLENGSANSIDTTGSGNAITSVSKSGNTLTFAKGSTFSLSTHNHDTVYKPIGYVPSWSEITGKPSTFAPSAHNHSWSSITGKPSTFTPSSHTHTIANITGLQSALDGKQPTISTGTTSQYYRGDKTWQTLNTSVVPEGANLYFTNARVKAYGDTLYSPLGHTHTIAQITGLQGALDSKATQSDIDTAIDELEIGGRNYYKKGMKPSQPSGTITTSMPEINGFKIEKTTSGGLVRLSNVITDNGYWTVSFVLLASVSGHVRLDITDREATNFYFNADEPTYIELTAYNDRYGSVYHFIDFEQLPIGEFLIKNIKVEKGTKATDWTPAPEDQVNVYSNQTIGGVKTFTGNVVIKGAAANTPLKVRGIDGHIDSTGLLDELYLNFVSTKNILMVMGGGNVGIGTTSPLYKLDVLGTGRFTNSLITPKVDFGNGFSIEPSGTELVFKYNGVIKQRMLSTGTILATGGVTALATS